MKKSVWIIAIMTLTISACTSQKQATSFVNDDVYNTTSRQDQVLPAPVPPVPPGEQVITSPDNAKAQKPVSSTLEDDYNDYSYSSRINRFSNKDTTVGYFDDAYTGSASGGNQGDNDPDVNVYLGYGAGYGGYYGSAFSIGMGWGYPYSNWGWDYGWGYPYYGSYYGWGYPYYGYYGGYSPWYNPWYSPCCYCYGYNDWYSPYYITDSYYGSRKSSYRSDGGTGTTYARTTQTSSAGNALNRTEKGGVTPTYSRSSTPTNVQTGNPLPRTTASVERTTPANQEKYRYTRPTTGKQSGYQRTTTQRTTGKDQKQTTRQQPAPRYTRPETTDPAQRSGSAQSYSSPVYRQAKSSQEYLAPRSQNPGTTRSTNQNSGIRSGSGSSGTGKQQNATPGNNSRKYTSPSRTGSSGNITPTRTNSGNVAPSRSGNSGTYSAPSNSRSSGSYSAPSRSGGGNSGSSSGNSGNSGGGRRK